MALEPGESREVAVVLGAAQSDAAARQTLARFGTAIAVRGAIDANVDAWEDRLGTITVRTPDPQLDVMLNRWTMYQALSSRMWARMGLYQSSGAYGFRDQLQDAMALVYAEPALARAHLLRAAARQFLEGDVQHWWHPHNGRGVRTRISDDLVWLPHAVDHYLRTTGDRSVLDESVPFLSMRPLQPGELEIYDAPEPSDERGTLYEHCLRALRRACTRGSHGLPLIGTGDWNDGFSRVGVDGRGESVWLAWFLIATCRRFAEQADMRGDAAAAEEMRGHADGYTAAVERHAWDGAWYRRAYYDDDTPLGSATSTECQIDAIAQSWSVISGAGSSTRQAQAMASVHEHLVNEEAGLVMLLTPPFDRGSHDPGYIKGYLPGVRENGAQYTHAALWTVQATALMGDGDRAHRLYRMLNPLTHTATAEGVAVYQVEPYVVAADVYTAPGHVGRGGWTWYTGSASWMYRVGLESLLGVTKRGDTLIIVPSVPVAWERFEIDYRFGGSLYAIRVERPAEIREHDADVTIDGVSMADGVIRLVDDGGRHEVVVAGRANARSKS
jgi:cyclic beta-1,2-glucan synthetase